ncbi:hypothetical protein NDU88_007054 [Pleurodeles waltl]|uniref:B box-type domain-containing protein n=2 Tax=Pleurodeles waltl TaxID=8319 RepID=A0AAV7SRF4_PLEWA|nr:hypothetical protein NDU88_007054 [Pleurodeles waltl]
MLQDGTVCESHGEGLKLICTQDRRAICLVCWASEEHKNHAVRPIEEAPKVYKGILEELTDEVKKDCKLLHQNLKRAETSLLERIDAMKEKSLTFEGFNTAKYSNKISPFVTMIAEMEDCCSPAKDFLEDVKSVLLMVKRYDDANLGKHDAKRMNEEEVLSEQKEAKKRKTLDQASSSLIGELTASPTFKTKEGMSTPKKSTKKKSEILSYSFDNDAHEEQPQNRQSKWQDPEQSQYDSDCIIEVKSNPVQLMDWKKKYKADVRLDPDTANPRLILSEGGKWVRNEGKPQEGLSER